MLDLDHKIPDVATHLGDLGMGEHLDVGMFSHGVQLVLKQFCCGVKIQIQAREFSHAAAQAPSLFHQHNRIAGIGHVERRLYPGDATANDQCPFNQGKIERRKRLVVTSLGHNGPDGFDGLVGSRLALLLVDPARLLADVCDFSLIGIQARRLGCPAEGGLVHGRRASGDDDRIELVLVDPLADKLLPGVGTHVPVVAGIDYVGVSIDFLDYAFHIQRTSDIGSTVADKDADSFHCIP